MDQSFIGYWTDDQGGDEILHISALGRYIHFFPVPENPPPNPVVPAPTNPVLMRLWLKWDQGDHYRVWLNDEAKTWTVIMRMDDEELIIDRTENTFRYRRLDESKVPEKFEKWRIRYANA